MRRINRSWPNLKNLRQQDSVAGTTAEYKKPNSPNPYKHIKQHLSYDSDNEESHANIALLTTVPVGKLLVYSAMDAQNCRTVILLVCNYNQPVLSQYAR
jgi:hypothetical protein